MRMVGAHHLADDFRRLLWRPTRIEIEQPHAVEDTAMHRLQPIACVRQRAVHDGRKRVSEIALFQRIAQRDLVDLGGIRRNQCFAHKALLSVVSHRLFAGFPKGVPNQGESMSGIYSTGEAVPSLASTHEDTACDPAPTRSTPGPGEDAHIVQAGYFRARPSASGTSHPRGASHQGYPGFAWVVLVRPPRASSPERRRSRPIRLQ